MRPTRDRESHEQVARVEALLEEVEGLADPAVRDKALEVAAALLDLYGEGLARLVDHVAEHDTEGAMAEAVAGDELVSHLLLLHGLHPVPLEARVLGALEEVRPYLESHGGNVELLGVSNRIARLRLEGSCSGCPSSTMTLKLAIESAILKVAPDIERVEAEGIEAPEPAESLLKIEMVGGPAPLPMAEPAWTATEVGEDGPAIADVGGEHLLLLRVDGQPYAYRPQCPDCGRSLAEATLRGTQLACTGCDHRYDVRGAGRCLDAPHLHLEPVPLLVDGDGQITVAVGTAA